MIKSCTDKTKCKVKFNQHMSDEFEVKTGLRLGYALFSVPFNIALETIFKNKNKYGGLNLEDNKRQYGILDDTTQMILSHWDQTVKK